VKFGEGVELLPSSGGTRYGHARGCTVAITICGSVGRAPESPSPELRAELESQAARAKYTGGTPGPNRPPLASTGGMSNGVIWPLFHYLIDRIPLVVQEWEDYVAVNEQFADKVAEHARDSDLIWIPRLPSAARAGHAAGSPAGARAIGFFLARAVSVVGNISHSAEP